MDVTQLLQQQHGEVAQLFRQFNLAVDEGNKRLVFEQLAQLLTAHSAIEEKLFYPAIYAEDLKDQLQEAVEEHLSMKRLIANLLEMNVEDDDFEAKMTVLKEQVERHVEDEEGELFPQVRQNFPSTDLEALGTEMLAMFNELKQREPSEEIPGQLVQAASLD